MRSQVIRVFGGPSAAAVIILLATQSAALAVPAIIVGPWVDDISHSGARIYWQTDVLSSTHIKWGTSSGVYPNLAVKGTDENGPYPAGYTRYHGWFITTAPYSSTIYFQACSSDGQETCTSEQSFTTPALPSPHPATPVVPSGVPDGSYPTCGSGLINCVSGVQVTRTVGANCNDPATGLVAQWTAANWGDTVVIPATTVCKGNFVFPAKTDDTQVPHRIIITQTSDFSSLPSPGTRVDPTYAAHLPAIITNGLYLASGPASGMTQGTCYGGQRYWVYDGVSTTFNLNECVNAAPVGITNITGAFPAFTVTTGSSHGLFVGDNVYITGVGGLQRANGTASVVSVIDSTNVSVVMYNTRQIVDGNYSSGGTIARDIWQPVAALSGTSLPASCNAGDWFFLTPVSSASAALNQVYNCVASNQWENYRIILNINSNATSAIDLSTNLAHYLRFVGLNLTSISLPEDPLWWQYGGAGQVIQNGSLFNWEIVADGSNHITMDRCWIHGSGFPARNEGGIWFNMADDIAVLDSYITDFQQWYGPNEYSYWYDNNTSAGFVFSESQRVLFQDNYLENYGIQVHFDDSNALWRPGNSDVIVERNYFKNDFAYQYGSPTSNGRYYSTRHHLELKQCQRCVIDGNIFDGRFKSLNNGLAVWITPTGGATPNGMLAQNNTNGTILTNFPHFWSPGDRILISYGGGNWLPIENHGMWTITAVPDNMHITVAGTSSDSGSYINWLNDDNGVHDVSITNNTFEHLVNGIGFDGFAYSYALPPRYRNFNISNNLFEDILDDGSRTCTGAITESGGGYAILYQHGMEDVNISQNTFYQVSGVASEIVFFDQSFVNPNGVANASMLGEGMALHNNLIWLTTPATGVLNGAGTQGLAVLAVNQVNYSVVNNLIARPGGDPGGYPAQNVWTDNSVPLVGPFVRSSTPFDPHRDCPGCVLDNSAPGANMAALRSAQSGVTDPCAMSLSIPGTDAPSDGGGGEVLISASASRCSWKAVSSASWLHVTGPASGSGNGGFNYSVDANAGAARSGKVTIGSQSFVVTQAGK